MSGHAPAGRDAPLAVAFEVRAVRDPQIVLRLLNFFAQRDLLPDRVRSARVGDELMVTIVQRDIAEPDAEVIAEKMRQLVPVRSVTLECRLLRAAA